MKSVNLTPRGRKDRNIQQYQSCYIIFDKFDTTSGIFVSFRPRPHQSATKHLVLHVNLRLLSSSSCNEFRVKFVQKYPSCCHLFLLLLGFKYDKFFPCCLSISFFHYCIGERERELVFLSLSL